MKKSLRKTARKSLSSKSSRAAKSLPKSSEKPCKTTWKGTLALVALTVAWVSLAYFVVGKILAWLILWIFHPTENNVFLQSFYSILCYLISAVVIILVPYKFRKSWKTTLEDLGIIELPTWADIGLAPAGFIAYMILAYIFTIVFSLFPWFNATEKQDVGYNSLTLGPGRYLALTVLVVVAPIAEEIIFRGYLYGKLKKHLTKDSAAAPEKTANSKAVKIRKRQNFIGTAIAIFLTSVVFGIMHGQWNVGVNVFAMSIILCLLREITGSIYAGILMHMLKNAVAFYLLYIVGLG